MPVLFSVGKGFYPEPPFVQLGLVPVKNIADGDLSWKTSKWRHKQGVLLRSVDNTIIDRIVKLFFVEYPENLDECCVPLVASQSKSRHALD